MEPLGRSYGFFEMPRPLLACAFAPSLAAVSGYFRRMSGMVAPMRSKAAAQPAGAPEPGEHTRRALLDWGFATAEIDELADAGVIVNA
jgi:crotonobetainyl-CoA:carnitine CoA-transferase CaiB-like acyl-CoA transferase